MDKDEAREVLRRHLESYRRQSYTRLAALIGKPQTCELPAPSGTSYQIEVEAFWEDNPNGDIHVIGSVDDGGGGLLSRLARTSSWHPTVPWLASR